MKITLGKEYISIEGPITKEAAEIALHPDSISFDGDGHLFFFGQDSSRYERAQTLARLLMKFPKSKRPRGWTRGRDEKGRLFVKIRLH